MIVKSGSSPRNASIYLDVKRKKVRFRYPKDGNSLLMSFIGDITWIWFVLLVISIFIQITIQFIIGINISVDTIIETTFVMSLIVECIIRFKYKWVEKIYPKLNYYISLLCREKYSIKTNKLYDTSFIIPTFRNIMLSYKATKDFAKELIHINITPVYFRTSKNKRLLYTWKVTFIFNKIPHSGYLQVEFV